MSNIFRFDRNEKDIWRNWKITGIWMTLLSLASKEDATIEMCGKNYNIQRGQLITSLTRLAKEIGCSRPTLIKYLKILEEEHELQRVTIGQKFAIYTILRFDYYFPLKLNSPEPSNEVKQSTSASVDNSSSLYSNNIKNNNKEQEGNNSKRKRESASLGNKVTEELWQQEIINDAELINQLCQTFGQPREELLKKCRFFFSECHIKNNYHKNKAKIQEHLFNWLRSSYEKQEEFNLLRNSIEKRKEVSRNAEGLDPKRGCPAPGELPKFKPDGTKRFFSKS